MTRETTRHEVDAIVTKVAASVVLFSSDGVERRMIERYLAARGATVLSSGDVVEAIQHLDEADVLVLRLDGESAAPVAHAREYDVDRPILVLVDNPAVGILAYRWGADIVAQLPMDLDLLCCKVEVLAARHAGRRPQPSAPPRV